MRDQLCRLDLTGCIQLDCPLFQSGLVGGSHTRRGAMASALSAKRKAWMPSMLERLETLPTTDKLNTPGQKDDRAELSVIFPSGRSLRV